jgi:eukaryotic-like serine/threonine-protein kinase
MSEQSRRFYEFGSFSVHVSKRLLRRNGEPVPLEPKVLETLLVLVENRGCVLTKDELLKQVWGDTIVEEGGLTRNISVLRKVLGERRGYHQYIVTVPGRGYQFVADVQERSENGEESRAHVPVVLESDSVANQGKSRMNADDGLKRRRILGVTATIVLILAGLLGTRWFPTWFSPSDAPSHLTLVRLTSTSGVNADPALSWDGTLLAFASDRRGAGNLDIWVQPVGGGDPMRRTSDSADETEPSFSPDGAQIVFSQREAGIHVMGVLGGEPHLVVPTPRARTPRFSPDGRWIAYWTGFPPSIVAGGVPGALGSMFVVASSGGLPRPIQTHLASARYPIWSPDGEHILFLGEEDPDQKTHDWYVIRKDGSDAIKTGAVPALRAAGLDVGMPIPGAWIAQGDAVVFATNETDNSNVWQIPITPSTGRVSGRPRPLTSGTAIERNPTVSDSGRIAFMSVVENVDVWRLPLNTNVGVVTGALERVTDDAGSDRLRNVSIDGKHLLFLASRKKRPEVFIRNLETGRERQLTYVGAEDASVSPDGQRVAFSRTEAGTQRIEIFDTAGGLPSRLCEDCYGPSDWSRDGKRLLLGRGLPSGVLVHDLPTGQLAQLLAHPQWSLFFSRFSPDGKWVTFFTANSPNVRQIYAAPVSLDGPILPNAWVPVVTDHGCHPSWSPDGSLLYHFSFRDGTFCPWVQTVDPATKRPIGLPRAVRHFHDPRLRATSGAAAFNDVEGGYLYMSLTESTGNIWLLEDKE